jgi:hypothetical protein
MINGDVFTLSIPRLQAATRTSFFQPDVVDGCETNQNYYTDPNSRGTCCCSCDKAEADLE